MLQGAGRGVAEALVSSLVTTLVQRGAAAQQGCLVSRVGEKYDSASTKQVIAFDQWQSKAAKDRFLQAWCIDTAACCTAKVGILDKWAKLNCSHYRQAICALHSQQPVLGAGNPLI